MDCTVCFSQLAALQNRWHNTITDSRALGGSVDPEGACFSNPGPATVRVGKEERRGEKKKGNTSLLVARRLPEDASRRAAACGDLPAQHSKGHRRAPVAPLNANKAILPHACRTDPYQAIGSVRPVPLGYRTPLAMGRPRRKQTCRLRTRLRYLYLRIPCRWVTSQRS
ncbi:hypothetical protein LY78DRAFT_26271 [Colletotrichum sublineola]|nr:hypothetical protein LY78DRAFT_26271 [Colletotrichum sublineola]